MTFSIVYLVSIVSKVNVSITDQCGIIDLDGSTFHCKVAAEAASTSENQSIIGVYIGCTTIQVW